MQPIHLTTESRASDSNFSSHNVHNRRRSISSLRRLLTHNRVRLGHTLDSYPSTGHAMTARGMFVWDTLRSEFMLSSGASLATLSRGERTPCRVYVPQNLVTFLSFHFVIRPSSGTVFFGNLGIFELICSDAPMKFAPAPRKPTGRPLPLAYSRSSLLRKQRCWPNLFLLP